MSIRELPDKWILSTKHLTQSVVDCSKDLRAALPVWQRITEDPATWPPIQQEYVKLMIPKPDKQIPRIRWIYSITEIKNDYLGWRWCKLHDLDFPPEEST